jgi:hypothetical protein
MKDFHASDEASIQHRPARIALLADKVWEAASPIVAKGCIAAMAQPSPTTGFLIAVSLEIARRLVRTSGMKTLVIRAEAYGLAARAAACPRPAMASPTLNDETEINDEHPER